MGSSVLMVGLPIELYSLVGVDVPISLTGLSSLLDLLDANSRDHVLFLMVWRSFEAFLCPTLRLLTLHSSNYSHILEISKP